MRKVKKATLAVIMGMICVVSANASVMAMVVPDSSDQYILENGNRQYIDTFTISDSTNPEDLIKDTFELDGFSYTYYSIEKEPMTSTDTKTITQEVSVESDNKEVADNLPLLEGYIEYNQDGYVGKLNIMPASVTTEAKGYETRSYTVSDTRTYTDLAYNDPSLIPQTVTKSGMTLKLVSTSWQGVGGAGANGSLIPTSYTATASYSAVGSSKYATGYVTKATYTGEVVKSTTETVYTVTYLGVPAIDEEALAIEAQREALKQRDQILFIVIAVILAGMLALAAVFIIIYLKKRKQERTAFTDIESFTSIPPLSYVSAKENPVADENFNESVVSDGSSNNNMEEDKEENKKEGTGEEVNK